MNRRQHKWAGAVVMLGLGLMGSACGDDETTGTSSASSGQGGQSATTGGSGSTTSSGMAGSGGNVQCGGSATTAECTSYCSGVVAAACPDGPTQQECEQSCGMLNGIVDQCPAWGAVVDCAGSAPTFVCFMGETVPDGCEGEFYCLSQCF
jgi:hypothetical protein